MAVPPALLAAFLPDCPLSTPARRYATASAAVDRSPPPSWVVPAVPVRAEMRPTIYPLPVVSAQATRAREPPPSVYRRAFASGRWLLRAVAAAAGPVWLR